MVSKAVKIFSILSLLYLLTACGGNESHLSWSDYQVWMGKESSQLKRVKSVNNITISAVYLPPDYLGYRDLLSSNAILDSTSYQNAKSNYQCGLTFRVLVEPEEGGVNLLYHKVDSESAYKRRVSTLSFKSSDYISMSLGDQIYQPVLTNYEGYNEIQNRLVFTAVFQPEEFDCGTFQSDIEELTLTFEDPFWSTGINHFTYGISNISDVPQILMN